MVVAVQSREPPPPSAQPRPDLWRWITTVDHKDIGVMYLAATTLFFIVGGLEALVMRIQLAVPRNTVLSPDAYSQYFTMHGTTMVFLVGTPVLFGFANYIVPLQIGARDMIFPRLNALSFWLFLFGGLFLNLSFLLGVAPNGMWFMYPPQSLPPFTTSPGPDYWAAGLLVTSIGTIATSINMVVTVLLLRAPGMTLTRVPLFVWTVVVTSFIALYAFPILAAGQIMLLLDRVFGARFFDVAAGGSPILWQHVFWSFGHPEVYILILPAFGIISETIPVFSGKRIFGYAFIAGSAVAIAFLSFLVWAHHMFTSGLGDVANLFFALSTSFIAIPTGVKIFNWLGTIWQGNIRYTTAMLFSVGLIANFIIGGLTGPVLAAVPVNQQVHDSYFVVAHLHYVLFGGTMLGVFAGTYYWFPKLTGRMLDEGLGKTHFWLTMVGLNLAFFPQHLLGLIGMPRHFYTYPDLPGWSSLNLLSSIGTFILAASVIVFVVNVVRSVREGTVAGDDPWDGHTLEWATTSPPPSYNFGTIPTVRDRYPLLTLKRGRDSTTEGSPA
jgi:cytochrome c oxidase subunit I